MSSNIASARWLAWLLTLAIVGGCADAPSDLTGPDADSATCEVPADCPGADSPCREPRCAAGVCGFESAPAGTEVADQESGTCERLVCDGEGDVVGEPDGDDLPDDGNVCTADLCEEGGPSHPPLPLGTACGDGDLCDGDGVCVDASVWIVRVGDESASIASNLAAPVVIEHRRFDGSLVGTIELPTAPAGGQLPLTLKGPDGIVGAGVLEGALSRSADGAAVTLGGFAAEPGEQITDTSAAEVPRVVARIDASGTVDTSTRLTSAFSGGESGGVRAVVAGDDPDDLWVSGNGADGSGGVHYATLGSSGASTQLVTEPNTMRWLHIADGQLYGSAAGRVFSIGDGLPAAGSPNLADIPDVDVSSPSGFAVLDRRVAVAGPDTLYVAETGGIRRFEIVEGSWTLTATFDGGEGIGARGLAIKEVGAALVVFAVTSESEPESDVQTPRVIAYIDDRTTDTPELIEIAPHTPNTIYRGISLPPTAD